MYAGNVLATTLQERFHFGVRRVKTEFSADSEGTRNVSVI